VDSIEKLANAIEAGDLRTVQRAIDKNPALLKAKVSSTDTPLHLACWQKQAHIVRFLLERNASVNVHGDNGRTPLHYAAFEGDEHSEEIGRLLLDADADPNAPDAFGRTPLDCAVSEALPELDTFIRLLLDRGAEMTVFSAALQLDKKKFEKVLASKGEQTPDELLEQLLEIVEPKSLPPEKLREMAFGLLDSIETDFPMEDRRSAMEEMLSQHQQQPYQDPDDGRRSAIAKIIRAELARRGRG